MPDLLPPIWSFRQIVRCGLIGAGSLILLGYFIWQARFLLLGPQIILTNHLPTIQHEPMIWLEGSTHNITSLKLNGRQIFTDPQGHFKEALVLENGYTITTIKAQDRYGRTATIEREFVYVPATLIPE